MNRFIGKLIYVHCGNIYTVDWKNINKINPLVLGIIYNKYIIINSFIHF